MSKLDFDYLSAMGIQRWHLRESAELKDEANTEVNTQSIDDSSAEPLSQDLPAEESQVEPQTTIAVAAVGEQNRDATDEGVIPTVPVVASDSWGSLVEELEAAAACRACQSSNPILGEGDLTAEWMWIIDAPSSQDISAQKLISGRAGQLFDAILQAVNLTRDQVYLTSVFKCPPSDDYTAQAGCGGLLRRQLSLIEPKKVVALGEFTAQALLRSNSNLEQLRGSVHQPRSLDCNVIATHGIQDMLTRPELKAVVWHDLCQLYRS